MANLASFPYESRESGPPVAETIDSSGPRFEPPRAPRPAWWQTLILALAGFVGTSVGAYLLFAPANFRDQYGIALGSDPSEMSETRAPGAVLLGFGIVILFSAARRTMTVMASAMGAVLFLSWGLSRVFTAAVDGVPSGGLVLAGAVEVATGAASAAVFMTQRRASRARTAQNEGLR